MWKTISEDPGFRETLACSESPGSEETAVGDIHLLVLFPLSHENDFDNPIGEPDYSKTVHLGRCCGPKSEVV